MLFKLNKLLQTIRKKNRRIKDLKYNIKEKNNKIKEIEKKYLIATGRAEKARLHYLDRADRLETLKSKIKAHIASQAVINLEIGQKTGINQKHNYEIKNKIEEIESIIKTESRHIYNSIQ